MNLAAWCRKARDISQSPATGHRDPQNQINAFAGSGGTIFGRNDPILALFLRRHRFLLHNVAARGSGVRICSKIALNFPSATPKFGDGPQFKKRHVGNSKHYKFYKFREKNLRPFST